MILTEPVRLLQVLYSGLGGHWAVASTLIEALADDDSLEHCLVFLGIEPLAPGYAEACISKSIPYLYVPGLQGRPWAAWPQLVRAIQSFQPDFVILHSIKAIVAARFACGNRPIIAVEHQPNALKSRSEWMASVVAQGLADRVVVLSRDYDLFLRQRLGLLYSPQKTIIVPTGIDLSPYAQIDVHCRDKQLIRIGMAARFSPTKSQQILVEAIAHLVNTHPHFDWRLSLPGDGVRHADVLEAVRAADLEDRVELPGHLLSEDLPHWFATLDIYAHSSDGETLSTSLLQAMAAGVPVVAANVDGISDLLAAPAPGQDPLGRLVPARDPVAFAAAIAADAADPAQASVRATRARLYVMRHHSPMAMRAGYTALLESLA